MTVAALRTFIPSLRYLTNRKRGLISPRQAGKKGKSKERLLNDHPQTLGKGFLKTETSVFNLKSTGSPLNKGIILLWIWDLPSGSPPAGHRNGGEYPDLWRRFSQPFIDFK